MSVLTKFIEIYVKSNLRGSYRIPQWLANNFHSLHDVKAKTENGDIHLDLRFGSARGYFARPNYKTGEEKVIKQFIKPGDVVFDIGAHFGIYTILMSRLVGESGKVFAFEPNTELLPSLRSTVAENSNISLYECALSDKNGFLDLFVPEDASMASLSDWTEGVVGNVHANKCEVEVLDEMIASGELPLPSFIKCDVEGAELEVFSGALRIFNQTNAPVVLFELNKKATKAFGRESKEYLEFFSKNSSANYSFFNVTPTKLQALDTWDFDYTNVVAVPEVRLIEARFS